MRAAPIDCLAFLSRPDFPSGSGPIGDHLGLERLARRRPDLTFRRVELNARSTRVHLDGDVLVVEQADLPRVEIGHAALVLYMPVSFDVEETNLAPPAPASGNSNFAAWQWRPLTEYLEHVLPSVARCINVPAKARMSNNKLIQYRILTSAGFEVPELCISTAFPNSGPLAGTARLIRKNVSESGWKSATEFSPARLVTREEALDATPAIYQRPVEADHELRCYVMGEEVIFVRLEREQQVVDVRAIPGGPRASVVEGRPDWASLMIEAARCLGLEYAVIDAIPSGDELLILEVNSNGVWWFLPSEIGRFLESRFHNFVERNIEAATSSSTG